MSELKAKALHMGPAQCAVDLGDGSERGEYVNQDYILQKLGRPHRAINLMYCYYPNDEGWPGRASVVHADPSVQFAWDFPYDDYFTYKGGLNGTRDDEPFTCMRDVRRHGQASLLTMTIDPKVSDEHLRAIGQDLRTFGRVQLRINHEATGNWFSFNKRASYEEVAAFFAHASEIIREEAPNVTTRSSVWMAARALMMRRWRWRISLQRLPEQQISYPLTVICLFTGAAPYDVAEKGEIPSPAAR